MCQNSILIILFFFFTLTVSLMMFFVNLLSELMIFLSTHHMTDHLTCRKRWNNCNLILKIKIFVKYFYVLLANFWFWSVKIWYLKLCIQAQKAAVQNYLRKVVSKSCNSLQNIHEILLKMYCEIKLFQVFSLQSVPSDAHTQKSKKLKVWFNT